MSESPRDASVEALVGQAQSEISKASYATALELLRQAAARAPEDGEIRQLLERTEQASRRHLAAVTRHQAVLERARQVYQLLELGELEAARTQLREAGLQHGKHDALTALEERLGEQEEAARDQLAAAHAVSARASFESGDFRAALAEAERSLRLAPDPEAGELRDRARAELEHQAEQLHYQQAVEETRSDVERLISAREPARADDRLRRAIDQLGHHESFEDLGPKIDKAKVDLRFRQRIEWAERRAKEAEGLVAEADRRSLRGAYAGAVEQLEAALALDPTHPNLQAKLESARAALERQHHERQHAETLEGRVATVKAHLDALRLEQAEATIRAAIEELGEPHRFVALGTRLERLREVERGSREPPPGAAVDRPTEATVLRRQRALAAAYSWKQALLYPFRGFGLRAFGVLLGILLLFDLSATLPALSIASRALAGLVLFAIVGLLPTVVRATLKGRNLLPPWSELSDPRRWLRNQLRTTGLLMLASLPLLLWLGTRVWHGGLDPDSGPFGWLAAAFLGWLGAAFLVTAIAATEAFGGRHALRLSHHVRSLGAGEYDAMTTIHGLFAWLLLLVLLRATLMTWAPWLFGPFVRAIEVYGLMVAPHLIGVLVRRRRVELEKVYG